MIILCTLNEQYNILKKKKKNIRQCFYERSQIIFQKLICDERTIFVRHLATDRNCPTIDRQLIARLTFWQIGSRWTQLFLSSEVGNQSYDECDLGFLENVRADDCGVN